MDRILMIKRTSGLQKDINVNITVPKFINTLLLNDDIRIIIPRSLIIELNSNLIKEPLKWYYYPLYNHEALKIKKAVSPEMREKFQQHCEVFEEMNLPS